MEFVYVIWTVGQMFGRPMFDYHAVFSDEKQAYSAYDKFVDNFKKNKHSFETIDSEPIINWFGTTANPTSKWTMFGCCPSGAPMVDLAKSTDKVQVFYDYVQIIIKRLPINTLSLIDTNSARRI